MLSANRLYQIVSKSYYMTPASPPEFQYVCSAADLQLGKSRRVIIGETAVALFRLEEGCYAIEDTCSHQGASLAFGDLQENVVSCPRHGAMFDVRTGRVLSLPALHGVRSYPVRVTADGIFVGTKPSSDLLPDLLRLP